MEKTAGRKWRWCIGDDKSTGGDFSQTSVQPSIVSYRCTIPEHISSYLHTAADICHFTSHHVIKWTIFLILSVHWSLSRFRSTMTDERLNGLALLFVYTELRYRVRQCCKSRWLCYFVESRSICQKFYFLESKSSFKIFYFLESRM